MAVNAKCYGLARILKIYLERSRLKDTEVEVIFSLARQV